MMRYLKFAGFALVVGLVAIQGSAAEKKEDPGKALFLKHKCNSCHTVLAKSIGKVNPKRPDLSGVGLARKEEWLHLFLRKKVANEEGKKHKKRFAGSDEKRKVLVDWLLTLKTPPAKKEGTAAP